MDRYDLVVIGSGPCGASLAARLSQIDPQLLDRTMFLDKATHPRPKVCGGAITLPGQQVMVGLDFKVDMPHVRIDNVRLKFEHREIRYRMRQMGLVTLRDEFDASLVAQARARGMRLRENCAVTSLSREQGGIRLETSQGPLFARAVVGADGSNSMVRRHMNVGGATQVCRLLKVLTPEDEKTEPAFLRNEFLFDFTRIPKGIQGYYWEFPSYIQGKAFMNRGILDARIRTDRPKCDLKAGLRDHMAESNRLLDEDGLMGAPVRWYDRELPLAEPHLMLTGDAAGAEPLFAEGITFALMYGQLAAEQLRESFSRGDLSFSDWSARVRESPVGKQLHGRRVAAEFLYARKTPTLFRIVWPILNAVWGPLAGLLFPEDKMLPAVTDEFGGQKNP